MKKLLFLTTLFWLVIMFVGIIPFVTSKPPPNTELNSWLTFTEIAHLGKGWYLVGGILFLIVMIYYTRQANKLNYLIHNTSSEAEIDDKE